MKLKWIDAMLIFLVLALGLFVFVPRCTHGKSAKMVVQKEIYQTLKRLEEAKQLRKKWRAKLKEVTK